MAVNAESNWENHVCIYVDNVGRLLLLLLDVESLQSCIDVYMQEWRAYVQFHNQQ